MSVASPCINQCQLDSRREYCQGCLRTLDEIRAWSSSSDQEKHAVWKRLGRQPHEQTTVLVD
ncbi:MULTISPECIES: DUF1289 domain-containing protein [Deefgea]|uniref:DUF1289 domain-containing protein n=1 Tax=Deefgea chitinilytica TaxID=570276 RepID=A0ABS2CGW0_9NEIS|nr:DUF1289 domain-containing protein [Deefgea chitinilytica]MBM9889914.1 DUF1289 domain-containing protein [Deefgea sp. CFH1-16]